MLNRESELTVADGAAFGSGTIAGSAEVPAPLAVAVVVGLLLTGLIFWLCCPFPLPGSLSWVRLTVYAAIYFFAALAIYAIVLQMIYRLFDEQLELPFQEVMYQTAAPAAWTALLAILEHQRSPWSMAVPPIVAAQVIMFLRDVAGGEPGAGAEPLEEKALFSSGNGFGSTRRIRPAVITSMALQCGIALTLLGRYLFAGIWFAGATVYPIWKLSEKTLADSMAANSARHRLRLISQILFPLVLIGLVLVPFLKNHAIAGSFMKFLKLESNESQPIPASTPRHRGGFFSGLILLPHTKPIKQLMAPPLEVTQATFGSTLQKPLEIDFDGVYWYFEPIDERPLSDAPTVRGDPTKDTIHSTYHEPVAMVANQILSRSIALTCCRALRVEIIDRESSLGPMNLEVTLKSTAVQKGAQAISLGDVLIPFSAEHHDWIAQRPVDETLTFSFPKNPQLKEFNEITVAVKPFYDRAERGAHVAIQKFTLVP